jgi:hypothetical protein
MEGWATLYLGRAYWTQGQRPEALSQFQKAIAFVKRNPFFLANALSGLEETYEITEEFRAFCRRFREERPEVGNLPLMQWYLEPTQLYEFPQNIVRDDFVGTTLAVAQRAPHSGEQAPPLQGWVWHDPFNDCSYTVENGLRIHAANGRDLWHINLSAPRILQPVSGDFAVQTVCPLLASPSTGGKMEEDKPVIGGILLWKDKENYLRLDIGTRGKREISLGGCLGNKDLIIGRGRLPLVAQHACNDLNRYYEGRVFLRLERIGSRVNALCSADGVEWFTVGHADFSVEDPVEVGLHIGNIDRTIYHGAFPEGAAIRFESFELWGRK